MGSSGIGIGTGGGALCPVSTAHDHNDSTAYSCAACSSTGDGIAIGSHWMALRKDCSW